MKARNDLLGLVIIAAMTSCAGSALAWDTRWQFKQAAPVVQYGSGPTDLEMRKKFDSNSMNTFKGTIDGGSGYTVMRNLNGETMRGIIDRDGSGLLRDQNGKLYRINTRW